MQGKTDLLFGEIASFHGNDFLLGLRYSLPEKSTFE